MMLNIWIMLVTSIFCIATQASEPPYGPSGWGWTPDLLIEKNKESVLNQPTYCDSGDCPQSVADTFIRTYQRGDFRDGDCTASLFSTNELVILNRHCLPKGMKVGDECGGLFTFIFPALKDFPKEVAQCKRIETISNESDDFAILSLREPVKRRQPPPLKLNGVDTKADTTVILHSFDPGEFDKKIRYKPCVVKGDQCVYSINSRKDEVFKNSAPPILNVDFTTNTLYGYPAEKISKLLSELPPAPTATILREERTQPICSEDMESCPAGLAGSKRNYSGVLIAPDVVFVLSDTWGIELAIDDCSMIKMDVMEKNGSAVKRSGHSCIAGDGYFLMRLNSPVESTETFRIEPKAPEGKSIWQIKQYLSSDRYLRTQKCQAVNDFLAIPPRANRGARDLILSGCKIKPGNSGSPIQDLKGNLIGIAKGQINQQLLASLIITRHENGLLAAPPCWEELGRPLENIGLGSSLNWFNDVQEVLNAIAAKDEVRIHTPISPAILKSSEAQADKWISENSELLEWKKVSVPEGVFPGTRVEPNCVKGRDFPGKIFYVPYFIAETDLDLKPTGKVGKLPITLAIEKHKDDKFGTTTIWNSADVSFPSPLPLCQQ